MFKKSVRRYLVFNDSKLNKRLEFCYVGLDPQACLQTCLQFHPYWDGVVIPVHGYNIDYTFPGEYRCSSEIRRAYETELPNLNN